MAVPREIDCELCDLSIKLKVNGAVFLPTLTTKVLAKVVKIENGANVLDLGCGVGPLGILAARKGAGLVTCVDIMPEACLLAEYNARLNGVDDQVAVLRGNLFESVSDQTFEIIISDISAVAEEVARISPWYPKPVPAGGFDGTNPTLQMLDVVREHLKPKGKLYFPLLTLCQSQKILAKAENVFGNNLEVLEDKMIPFCPEFYQHFSLLKNMKRQKLIDFKSKKSRHLWNLKILLGTKV